MIEKVDNLSTRGGGPGDLQIHRTCIWKKQLIMWSGDKIGKLKPAYW